MIKPVLDSLNSEQKRLLMYAFENGFAQHIKLKGGRFIGVNITNQPTLKVEETAGAWSIGVIHDAFNVPKNT